jgi:hypothetical protein
MWSEREAIKEHPTRKHRSTKTPPEPVADADFRVPGMPSLNNMVYHHVKHFLMRPAAKLCLLPEQSASPQPSSL